MRIKGRREIIIVFNKCSRKEIDAITKKIHFALVDHHSDLLNTKEKDKFYYLGISYLP